MKLDIFGKRVIEVVSLNGEWAVFYCGNEGKKRKTSDIVIPAQVSEDELVDYLSDIFHEWATPKNGSVRVL